MRSIIDRRSLQARWRGQDARLAAIVADIQAGDDWTSRLLDDPGGRWKELARVREVATTGGEAAGRDLRGISLRGVKLAGVRRLSDARFDYAVLNAVDFSGTSLVNCNFEQSVIDAHSSFEHADLSYSRFNQCRATNVVFDAALFCESTLIGARFFDCSIRSARFNKVSLVGSRVRELFQPSRCARIIGDDVSGNVIDGQSDEFVRRFLDDEADAWALQKQRPFIAYIWYVLTNNGRSVARFFLWVIAVWLTFGWLYAGLPIPSQLDGTRLDAVLDDIREPLVMKEVERTSFTPFYLSALSLVTVGYGTPVEGAWLAEVLTVLEAVLGVIAWGCFVTLLFQTFPRRMG